MSTATRVIKNSGFLYIRMGITVFISLYTTRLILASLGASDFGIFNIVGGAIGMLGFLNSTLANATQRFMSYAEGKGDQENKKTIFNVSICLHIFIALVTLILLLTAMYPLFNGILNIEADRIAPAKVVYICLVISTILTIVNVPYDAVMNAHENMLYYAIIGIFESLLRLAVAFTCVKTSGDKLIVYGVLMACIPLVTLTIMKVYCHRQYPECVLRPRYYWDLDLVKEIASFSGWNFLTAITSLCSAQGIGLVLNHFFGTRLNAAQGVANQLNGQLSAFSITMLKALNPVIVKNAGANDTNSMNNATIAGCKYSTLLILFFSIPFIIEMPYILGLWLKEVPEWAATFCVLQLVQTIICQLANPAATAVYAQGDIKIYAIWKSVMNVIPILLTYLAFTLGGSPIWLYVPMITIWGMGGDIVIIDQARKKCNLGIKRYVNEAVMPIIIISVMMFLGGMLPKVVMPQSFARLIICGILTTSVMAIYTWFCVLTISEKNIIRNIVKQFDVKIKRII